MEATQATTVIDESGSNDIEDLIMKEDRSTPGMDYIWYDCLGDCE